MATYYYGETLLPEVPVLDGYPDYIIIKDERFTGYKYRVIYTTQGFILQYGSLQCNNQEERQNYLLPDGGSEWVDALSVGNSAYSYVDLSENKIQFIFTNRDINDYSTGSLLIAAMTPTAVTKNILVYLHNATANAENPSEISDTATLRFTPNGNAILPDSVVVLGASYTWDATTGTLELSVVTDTVRVWVGYAKQYRVPLEFIVSVADATRAKTGETEPLTLDEIVAVGGNGSDGGNGGNRTHALYGGVRLPIIPEDVQGKYLLISTNNDNTKYLLHASDNIIYHQDYNGSPCMNSGTTMTIYSCVLGGEAWELTGTEQSAFRYMYNLTWSNHDIRNGSATATDIYFYGHEPIPCY